MASTWESAKVDGSDMPLYLSVPASGGPVPGLVVVHGQSGLENFIQDTTHMLALQGYAAVAPNLYHRDGPDCKDDGPTRKARLRDTTIINDINAAIGFLKNHRQVDGGRLGIVGFCMGGRLVYLMSAASRDLKTGVMFYGGNTMTAMGDGPSPFDRTREISCPIQGHFGVRIKIHHPKTCANSTRNLRAGEKFMSSIPIRAPRTRSRIRVRRITGPTPRPCRGRKRQNFSADIWWGETSRIENGCSKKQGEI